MIDIPVADLLPHADKMVLLNTLLSYDDQAMVIETTVRDDGLFGDGNTVPAWLGIEYMAQTVAAHGGMMRYLSGKPIHIGFLLGTRRYTSNVSIFKVGTSLIISVKRLVEDQGLSAFECSIKGDDIEISATLNVYQPNKIDKRIFD